MSKSWDTLKAVLVAKGDVRGFQPSLSTVFSIAKALRIKASEIIAKMER